MIDAAVEPNSAVAGDVRLAARSLTCGYGKVPVVRGLDLEVRAGEVVALVGPNGAGKSTALLALAGAMPAMSGAVELDGRVTRAPLHVRAKQGLGFVPEQRAIFRKLSVLDNLRLGPAPVEDALRIAPELQRLTSRRAGLLSGGEQQILILARILAAHPRVVIADEVSLGLAPLVVRRMLGLLRAAADHGTAVLIVEQRLQNVLAVADRLYVMRRGEIEMTGTAAEMSGRLEEIQAAYLSEAHQPPASGMQGGTNGR